MGKTVSRGPQEGAEAYDAALDLQGLLKSALPLARVRAKQKLGFHWQREGSQYFSQRVIPDPSSLHVVDQYVDVARAAGAQADRADFDLVPNADSVASIRFKLQTLGVGEGRPLVLMNAGAGWASKRWPPEKFAFLHELLRDVGVAAVFLGGSSMEEVQIHQTISQKCATPPHSLLGQTNVSELIALVSLASVHVGGDTGSTHIAAALGRPAIGLYSRTRPERSCPYGQIGRTLYNPEGLENISERAVFQAVLGALG